MTSRSLSPGSVSFSLYLLAMTVCPEVQCQADAAIPSASLEVLTIDLPNLPDGARPMRLIRIPAGSFLMGSTETEQGRESDETPVHKVTIAYDFFIGETEVTQAQWLAVRQPLPGSIPGTSGGEGNDFPVYDVCWNDCEDFVEALNALGQGVFRLPSEAEWEYACRA